MSEELAASMGRSEWPFFSPELSGGLESGTRGALESRHEVPEGCLRSRRRTALLGIAF
ncbi:MAG: hypothetical protein LBT40_14580 [Deltaproteobacteria bacterium]|nr:hypothetical protein [Deltaproteobacteria bacterium]